MYGVLFEDGTVQELPGVVSAFMFANELVCYDADENVMNRFPGTNYTFGRVEVLERIARVFQRTLRAAVTA